MPKIRKSTLLYFYYFIIIRIMSMKEISLRNSFSRFDGILNSLRKYRTLSLKIAFPVLIVENILTGNKPHELCLWEQETLSMWAVIGATLVIIGAAVRIWARGHFVKGRLFNTGPYAIVRHPLYLGSLFVVLGVLFQLNDWLNWVVMITLFILFYGAAILFEERSLQKRFGQEWSLYRSKVPAFIPSFRNWPFKRQSDKWSWKVYLSTPELKTTLFFLVLPLLIEFIENVVFEDFLRI